MRQLNVSIDVNDDTSSDVRISFRFTEEIKEIIFPFEGEIKDIKTQYGECFVTQKVEKALHCKPPSPFMIGEITIITNFKAKGLTERHGNITLFSFDIPILWDTDMISMKVRLPDSVFIAEEDQVSLPISPSGAEKGIEGRRITASWVFRNKDAGDLIPIRIYYEGLSTTPIENFIYRWLFVVVLVFVVVIFFIYRSMSKRSELILSVLNEAERIVIDIVRKQGKDKVDQRKIVAQSGFSKAKVSRIIRSLESRGVISVEKIGRKNRISLRKISFKE
jgi:predicted transcriptional regulator